MADSGTPETALPSAVARYFDVPIPAGLDGVAGLIREHVRLGRRSAMLICVLLAHARQTYFHDDPAGWLEWARTETGFQRRHCFTCLRAGMLILTPRLPDVQHVALLDCDIPKLELLAAIPSHQLPGLLSRWDPAKATRDEVRAKVKLWDDPGRGEDDAEAKPKRPAKAPETPPARADRLVADLVRTIAGNAAEVRAGIDVPAAIRAAYILLDAALDGVQAQRLPWTRETYATFIDLARQAVAWLETRQAKAGA